MIRDNLGGGGGNTKNATASPIDILQGKTAYGTEGLIVGTMPNNVSSTITLDSNNISYTVPLGYHNGGGKVQIVPQEKTVEPSGEDQNITADAGKVLGSVTINPVLHDSGIGKECYDEGCSDGDTAGYNRGVAETKKGTALPADVLEGVTFTNSSIVEAIGTMPNRGAVNINLDLNNLSYTIPNGYHNGQGKVEINIQSKNAIPNSTIQTIEPESGFVLGSVTIDAVTKNAGIGKELYEEGYDIGQESGYTRGRVSAQKGTAESPQVLEGYTFTNASIVGDVGTMPNIGQQTAAPESGSVTITKGYHDGTGYVDGINAYNKGYNDGTAEGTQGTANTEQVLQGKSFTSRYGVNIIGTMPTMSTKEYYPTYGNKLYGASTWVRADDEITIPKGCCPEGTKAIIQPYIPQFKLVDVIEPNPLLFSLLKTAEVRVPDVIVNDSNYDTDIEKWNTFREEIYRPYFLPISKSYYGGFTVEGFEWRIGLYEDLINNWEKEHPVYDSIFQEQHNQEREAFRQGLDNPINNLCKPIFSSKIEEGKTYYITDNIDEIKASLQKCSVLLKSFYTSRNDESEKFVHNYFYDGKNTEYNYGNYHQDFEFSNTNYNYLKDRGDQPPAIFTRMDSTYHSKEEFNSFNIILPTFISHYSTTVEVPDDSEPIINPNLDSNCYLNQLCSCEKVPIELLHRDKAYTIMHPDCFIVMPKKIYIYEVAPLEYFPLPRT